MEDASSARKGIWSRIPLVLAVLWSGVITVVIIAVAASPDDFGLNGPTTGGLLLLWALGMALGLAIRGMVRWWRSGPARERIVPILVAFVWCGVLTAVVAAIFLASSGGRSSAPLAGLRWTDETPAWSPNGREIVFASNRARPHSGVDHLYLMSRGGTRLRRLTRDRLDAREPSFSPDGRQIAYASDVLDSSRDYTEKGRIDLISPDGTHRRSLTSGLRGDASVPAWSPDGRWIAFLDTVSTDYGAGSRSDLYVVRRNGTGLHRLAIDIDWSFTWAPDSRQIAVVGTNERLYRVGIDARRPVRVTGSTWGSVTTDVAWSPDGREIAYVRGQIDTSTCFCDADGSDVVNRHLWILDLETRRRHRVRGLIDSGSLTDFGVTVIWLHTARPLLAVFSGSHTALITPGGRRIRTIKTSNNGMLATGSASATGRELLFVDGPYSSYRSAIFVASAHGGRVRALTQRDFAAG